MVELKSKTGQPEVNLVVLDRLVHDYMLEEDLIDDEGTSMRSEASSPVILTHLTGVLPIETCALLPPLSALFSLMKCSKPSLE